MDDRKLLDTIRPLIGEAETADDCSMFDLGDGRILVSSTDMLHETTDFPKGMTELLVRIPFLLLLLLLVRDIVNYYFLQSSLEVLLSLNARWIYLNNYFTNGI